jgi:serralysin
MAKFTIGSDMPEFGFFDDFFDGETLAVSSYDSSIIFYQDANGAQIILTGIDLTFGGNVVTGGEISNVWFVDENGGTLIAVSDGSFDAVNLISTLNGDESIWEFVSFLSAGDDTIIGNSIGNDLNFGENHGDDTIIAGSGGSYIAGSKGDDILKGGNGWDTLSYEDTFYRDDDTKGIQLDVEKGTVADSWGDKDKISKFEEFRGSVYKDSMLGGKKADAFAGLDGADLLDGRGGLDDARYFLDEKYGGNAGISVNLAQQKIVDGFGDTDKVISVERIFGTAESDTFIGDKGDNHFIGMDGVDSFNGGKGFDVLEFYFWQDQGQHGADVDLTLSSGQIKDDGYGNVEDANGFEAAGGGDYDDTIKLGIAKEGFAWGGGGDDILTAGIAGNWLGGGDGSDTFVFLSTDAIGNLGKNKIQTFIYDFHQDEDDVIDLTALGDLTFIGNSAFSGSEGELRYQFKNGNTLLQGDIDGNGAADFSLELEGKVKLVGDDLMWS